MSNHERQKQLMGAKLHYRSCIKWYLDVLRFHESIMRKESWTELGISLREEAKHAIVDAQQDILTARSYIEDIEKEILKLKNPKCLPIPEESNE